MPEQMSLFARPAPPGPVGPAAHDEALRTLAAGVPRTVRMGTSSWSFPGWKGIVWDRDADAGHLSREGLPAYAKHPLFRTVGIDRTFYAPIDREEFTRYARDVPDDFRFLVKAASECTSPRIRDRNATRANAHYLDVSWAIDHVVGPFISGLGHNAGPLVFQFPPLGSSITGRPENFAEQLERFLEKLQAGPWYAVEIRDQSLFGRAYISALAASGASHCLNVHPRMPGL